MAVASFGTATLANTKTTTGPRDVNRGQVNCQPIANQQTRERPGRNQRSQD
jgi:hypothetical protein